MDCRVDSLDHLVLTVRDIGAAVSFYVEVLGMREVRFGERFAVAFGSQKINFHLMGSEVLPNARLAGPGTADLCFLSETLLSDWAVHLAACGVAVELGPTPRTGALFGIVSLYVRDPDGNLIEISNRA